MGALKSYTACAEDAGSRIDAVLAAHGLYPSRSAAARAVEDGAVYVNGSTVAKKHTLCAGDTVVYEVPDAPEQGPVQGQAIPLDIRYEDDDMLVISKQAGLVCHPSIGMIDAPIARSLNERTRMAVRECPSARDALTTFRVLERFEHGPRDNGYTLIDCKLYTGRTHQIRVHMQYAKHPLVGDPVYNSGAPKDADANFGLDRQFLHSFQVGFTQPMTGEDLFFADNLTDDLAAVLDQLASRSLGRTEAGREVFELLADSPHPTAPVHHLEDFGAL